MSDDAYRSKRKEMVDVQIRKRGIKDDRVLQLLEEIPRERFVPPEIVASAFDDGALSIACGQTISQPFMVAAMTESLDVQPHHRVLEVGTGSGYQTAVLSRLAKTVYTIERLAALQATSRVLLESFGVANVKYRVGDGSLGWPDEAPFDRIMVTAGAPEVPHALVDQLVNGGRLVIPVGNASDQTLTVVERIDGKIRETPRFTCRFVKLIGAEAWSDASPGEITSPNNPGSEQAAG